MVVAREWMLGSRDEFLYMECAACGCVQRTQIVPDMSRYYPQGKYYSISIHGNALRRLAFRLRARSYFNRSLIGKVVAHHWPQNDLEAVLKLNPKKDWRILDIGCGSGRLLFELADNGFLQLFGADPFIEQKIVSGPVCIWKSDMPDGEYDLIMLHHSLEHIPNQLGVLRSAAQRLSPDGKILIRIPVIGWAWREYRENWVQLDPPRHEVLHTQQSLAIVASQAGLKISETYYDSGLFQIFGSDLLRRGKTVSARNKVFPASYPDPKELNRRQDGDSACFVMELA